MTGILSVYDTYGDKAKQLD